MFEDAILITWNINGDVDIDSDVYHNTYTNLDLDGWVAEAAADAEAAGDAVYTFTATETFADDSFAASSSYSISQVDDVMGGGNGELV